MLFFYNLKPLCGGLQDFWSTFVCYSHLLQNLRGNYSYWIRPCDIVKLGVAVASPAAYSATIGLSFAFPRVLAFLLLLSLERYRWYSIWRRHRRFFRPHPSFPMFSRRLRGGLRCFNVLTPAIVFNWEIVRLKIIFIIFPTFLSTTYTFTKINIKNFQWN